MESTCHGFDFTAAMRRLCADITARLPEFGHIKVEHVAFNVCQTRQDVTHGMFASLTPLRFEEGADHKIVRGVGWGVERLRDATGREFLYLLSFYLPRFQNATFEMKLTTVFHELWHIGPEFNGDVRRLAGRCYAHGPSQRDYDADMTRLAQSWLSQSPPCHLFEFLSLNFAELIAEHGRVIGSRWPKPKLVRRSHA